MPKTEIDVPLSDQIVTFRNQAGLILFHNLRYKTQFYERLAQGASDLVIFECGSSILTPIPDALLLNCKDISLLLNQLQSIPDNRHEAVGPRHLNTLIVDNVSAFYWDLKCLKRAERLEWYVQLSKILKAIELKYACNVIVTAWDSDFEKGFNYRKVEREAQKLEDCTFLPHEFLQGMDYVFHQGDVSMKYEK